MTSCQSHMTLTRCGPMRYRCVACGTELVAADTMRALWAEIGRRLQHSHRRKPDAAPGQGSLLGR